MDIENLRSIVEPLLESFVKEDFNILLANVSTEDGFVVGQNASPSITIDDDKVAAISSSLLSLAEASVNGIREGIFKRAIVESETAHLLVISGHVREVPIVATVVATEKSMLAHTLYLASKLIKSLAQA